MVSKFQPSSSNFFNWTDDKSKFENTTFSIDVINSNEIPAELKKEFSNSNSFTTMAIFKNGKKDVRVSIIYDRVLFDAAGQERLDGFARLVTALGHEIYGNVQTYCEMILKDNFESPVKQRDREIKAFTAGVDFLKRVLNSTLYSMMPPGEAQKAKADIKNALSREEAGLASWKKPQRKK